MWAYLNGSDNTWPSERKHASLWIIMNVPFDTPVDAAGVADYGDNISLIRAFPCPQIRINMPSVPCVCCHTYSAEGRRRRQTREAAMFLLYSLLALLNNALLYLSPWGTDAPPVSPHAPIGSLSCCCWFN